MGRPKDFVTDDVLDRAAEVFWRCGYEATSIPDLEAATGLGRGSLYNTFGDKERLYLAALRRYQDKFGSHALSKLDEDDVGAGIRLMFEALVERMSRSDNPPGCLMTNSTIECDGSSREIESLVATNIVRMEALVEKAIARAIETEQIVRTTDAKRLARFYVAIAQSLGVLHKASPDMDRLRDVVDVAMQSWPCAHEGR